MIPSRIGFVLLVLFGHLAAASGIEDLFSPEQHPGTGTLVYTVGKKSEQISFGKTGGHYGSGVLFQGALLPAPYRKDFKKSHIIQVALGTLRDKVEDKVPQFGSCTVILTDIPKARKTLELMLPTGLGPKLKEKAFLLFSSPSTLAAQSDEDKLKSTFFAKGGTVDVIPMGLERKVSTFSQGKTLNFRMMPMRFEVHATLATPFTTEVTKLEGAVEFPVYWPSGKDSRALATRLANESLGNSLTLPPGPEGLTVHNRDIAGSTKKNKDSAPSQ